MAFDETLANRVRTQLGTRRVEEKRMFGGLCFMVNGHMCCGVEKGKLVIRVGPEQYAKALKNKHARPMDFTGKALKGFVYVERAGFKTSANLGKWLEMGLSFVYSLPTKKPKKKKP